MSNIIDFRRANEKRMLDHQKQIQTLLDDQGKTVPLARVATLRNLCRDFSLRVLHYDRVVYGTPQRINPA